MTVTITPLTEREFFSWYSLLAEYAANEGVALTDEHVMRVFTALQEPDAIALVAHEQDGTVVGLVHARRFERLLTEHGGYDVDDLFVAQDARRRGIATALVERLRERADAAGRPTLRWAPEHEDDATRALRAKLAGSSDDRVLQTLHAG